MDDFNILDFLKLSPSTKGHEELTKISPQTRTKQRKAQSEDCPLSPNNRDSPASKLILSNRKFQILTSSTTSNGKRSDSEKLVYCDDRKHRACLRVYNDSRLEILNHLREFDRQTRISWFMVFACFCEEAVLNEACTEANPSILRAGIGHCLLLVVSCSGLRAQRLQAAIESIIRGKNKASPLHVIVRKGSISESAVASEYESRRDEHSLRYRRVGDKDVDYVPSESDTEDDFVPQMKRRVPRRNNESEAHGGVVSKILANKPVQSETPDDSSSLIESNSSLPPLKIVFISPEEGRAKSDVDMPVAQVIQGSLISNHLPNINMTHQVFMGSSVSLLNGTILGTLGGFCKDSTTATTWALTSAHIIGSQPCLVEAPSTRDVRQAIGDVKVFENDALRKADVASRHSCAKQELEQWQYWKRQAQHWQNSSDSRSNTFGSCERWIYDIKNQEYGTVIRSHLVDVALILPIPDRIGINTLLYPRYKSQSHLSAYKRLSVKNGLNLEEAAISTVFKVGRGTGPTWGIILPTCADVKRRYPRFVLNDSESHQVADQDMCDRESQEWCIVGFPGISGTFSTFGDSGSFVLHPVDASLEPSEAEVCGVIHSHVSSHFTSRISVMTPWVTIVDTIREKYGIKLEDFEAVGNPAFGAKSKSGCIFCQSLFHTLVDCPHQDRAAQSGEDVFMKGHTIHADRSKARGENYKIPNVDIRRAFRTLNGCYFCWSLKHKANECPFV